MTLSNKLIIQFNGVLSSCDTLLTNYDFSLSISLSYLIVSYYVVSLTNTISAASPFINVGVNLTSNFIS